MTRQRVNSSKTGWGHLDSDCIDDDAVAESPNPDLEEQAALLVPVADGEALVVGASLEPGFG